MSDLSPAVVETTSSVGNCGHWIEDIAYLGMVLVARRWAVLAVSTPCSSWNNMGNTGLEAGDCLREKTGRWFCGPRSREHGQEAVDPSHLLVE